VDGFVGTVTLNHPEKRNALSEQLVEGIIAAFEDFKARSVRVVILRALPGSRVVRRS
jgi:methylmalonyl-CoA decarboxylase